MLFWGVSIHCDVIEMDVVDALARSTVVFLTEQYPQVEDASALNTLDADAVEPHVLDDILIATLNGQQPLLPTVEIRSAANSISWSSSTMRQI